MGTTQRNLKGCYVKSIISFFLHRKYRLKKLFITFITCEVLNCLITSCCIIRKQFNAICCQSNFEFNGNFFYFTIGDICKYSFLRVYAKLRNLCFRKRCYRTFSISLSKEFCVIQKHAQCDATKKFWYKESLNNCIFWWCALEHIKLIFKIKFLFKNSFRLNLKAFKESLEFYLICCISKKI